MSRPRILALCLVPTLLLLLWLQLVHGEAGALSSGSVWTGLTAVFGVEGDGLSPADAAVVRLRLWRALCAGGVGAALAASGALLQGLFRNPLASPSLLGVTTGATLGATFAILIASGVFGAGSGSALVALTDYGAGAPVWVTLGAFAGALAVGLLILAVASVPGGVSVATLLLVGVAVNTFLGGAMATAQSLTLEDWDASRAVLAWTFGTLDDRKGYHAGMVACGVLAIVVALPWLARELDLFAAGDQDAAALGVHVRRTRTLALLVTCFATGCAVATAGVVSFVGLVVPHMVRLWVGNRHLPLVVLSLLGGAVLVLAADLGQLLLSGGTRPLQPGVLMSVLGGPVFFWLLLRTRREVRGW